MRSFVSGFQFKNCFVTVMSQKLILLLCSLDISLILRVNISHYFSSRGFGIKRDDFYDPLSKVSTEYCWNNVWQEFLWEKPVPIPRPPISNTNPTRITIEINTGLNKDWGRAVVQWLRHYATNRQVTGSIPRGVIGIFQWHNPSGRNMALGSTQPLNRNEYQVYFLGVKAAGA